MLYSDIEDEKDVLQNGGIKLYERKKITAEWKRRFFIWEYYLCDHCVRYADR